MGVGLIVILGINVLDNVNILVFYIHVAPLRGRHEFLFYAVYLTQPVSTRLSFATTLVSFGD